MIRRISSPSHSTGVSDTAAGEHCTVSIRGGAVVRRKVDAPPSAAPDRPIPRHHLGASATALGKET
jgi:hypothetical protein